ncbi:MAG: zf-HC2 domain-containing protein [Candidatus Rokubacteria bacterium]|nr:zf-HC2 domain-containing protein [Candidatus Rokubacteria bacterium]
MASDRTEEPSAVGCRECVDLLADYVEGALPRHEAALLESHLDGCPPCVAFVNTYKGTVGAARRLREVRIPPEVEKRLIAFLKRPDVSR